PRGGATVPTGRVVTGGEGTPAAGAGPATAGAKSAGAGARGTVGSRAGARDAGTRALVLAASGTSGPVSTCPTAPRPRRPPLRATTTMATARAPGTTNVTAAAPNPPRRQACARRMRPSYP